MHRRVSIRCTTAVVVVAAALVLASCSGSDPKPATRAQLQSTLLKTGDLPSNWVAKPHDSSDDDDSDDSALDAKLASCLGVSTKDVQDDNDAKTVYSPDFTSGQSEVSSEAEPADEGGLTDILGGIELTSKKTESCFEQGLRALLDKQAAGEGIGIDSVDVDITKGKSGQPSNVKFNLAATIGISAAGQKVALYLAFVNIVGNGVDATVDIEGFGAPVPASVQKAAIAAVSKRVDAA